MADVLITDLDAEMNLLRARIDAIRGEVTTFLEEVGAPNLVEARDRFRRFATAAIELPKKIETLQAIVVNTDKGREDALQRMQLQINAAKELRLKAATDKKNVNDANKRLLVARAAINDAVELLESPEYASLINSSRRVISSLNSSLREIPADIEVTEE